MKKEDRITILGMLEAGVHARDVVSKVGYTYLSVLDEHKWFKGLGDDIDALLIKDKVEIEKAKHTVIYDLMTTDVQSPRQEIIESSSDLELLELKTKASAIRVIDEVSHIIFEGVNSAELSKLADVILKINEAFFKSESNTNINILNNQDSGQFSQFMKD